MQHKFARVGIRHGVDSESESERETEKGKVRELEMGQVINLSIDNYPFIYYPNYGWLRVGARYAPTRPTSQSTSRPADQPTMTWLTRNGAPLSSSTRRRQSTHSSSNSHPLFQPDRACEPQTI